MLSVDAASRFLKENRLYVIMLAVIVVFEVFMVFFPAKVERSAGKDKKVHRILTPEEAAEREARIKDLLSTNKPLAFALSGSTFACSIALMAGLVMLVRRVARKLNGFDIMPSIGVPPDVSWGIVDIFRIAVIFYFFGYLVQAIELGAATAAGIKHLDEKLFTVMNATLMDVIGLMIVLYFVLKKYGRKLSSLGLKAGNIARDIKIGLSGYLMLIPIIVVIMVFVLLGLRIFNYEPPETRALEMLYETDRPKLLFILTGLVTLLGPVMEELFFRGFAYPVVRKKMGARNAIILVSLVFSLLHLNIVSFFPILALGILLAYLYEKTGSIIPCIAVHIVHNTTVVFFVFLYRLIAVPG
ncbi:MAG: CPBP family intramembrane glutamic endopeptidase [Candidatus Omnitrophota bacterium]